MHQFIGSLIHQFTIHSLIHCFIDSLVRGLTNSFIRSFVPSFIHSFFHSFIHSFFHPFIHSFIHSHIIVLFVQPPSLCRWHISRTIASLDLNLEASKLANKEELHQIRKSSGSIMTSRTTVSKSLRFSIF
jgi:hypothetical protein